MENVKKLQRDTQHKVIGGVCSGLANYFGIDAVLVRLLFVIAFLVFSTGFWIYLILWIVMPASRFVSPQADYVVAPNGDAVEAEEVPQEAKPADNPVDNKDKKEDPDSNKKSSLVVGLVLIGVGALGLLHRFVPEFNWRTAWPILLIVLGLYLLLPPKQKES